MKNPFKKIFKVQQKVKKLGYDSQADTGKYKYDFVSLGKLKDKLDPILEENKMGYVQFETVIEGKNALRTIIYDEEVDSYEESILIDSVTILMPRTENNPQDKGSAITYDRRYMLLAIFGIVGDKDDDCFLEESEIKSRVESAKSVQELQKLYSSIRSNQQEEMKEIFSNKKNELLEELKKENEKIINNTEINEG